MKKLILLLVFAVSTAYGFEGPEFILLGRDYLEEISNYESSSPWIKSNPFELKLSDANLYNIKNLDWYYGKIRCKTKIGKLGFSFINYGINNLYERQKYAVSYDRRIWSTLALAAEFSREVYNYEGYYRLEHNDFLAFNASYLFKTIGVLAAVNELPTKRGVKYNSKHLELVGAVNWQANSIVGLHGIYFKDDLNYSRFDIGQKLNLAEPLAVTAGFITGPQVYYLGTIISYKGFAFEYVFYDVTQLPGCWSLALIIR